MSPERLRFGEFELDVSAYELRREGRAVRLERLAMELLLHLVDRRGQLVTREEIVEKLWGKDVFVDADTGVNTVVRKVRQALRDDPDQPACVQTVTGKGYRFIAPVTVVDAAPVPPAATWRPRASTWLPLALAAAGLVAAVTWLARRPVVPTVQEATRFTVTLAPGTSLEYAPAWTPIAVSPDGQQLAFVAGGAGRPPRLWIRRLDALSVRPIEATEDAVSPFWSPDGRFVGYFADGKLRRVPVQEGPAETICSVQSANSGSWSRDGTILFSASGGPRAGLWRVPATGGEPARVRTDAGSTETWPQFLPDGRHYLFLTSAFGPEGSQTILNVGALDSGRTRRLLATDARATYVADGRLVFVREGSLLAVPFDADALAISGEPSPLGETISYARATASALYSASSDGRVLVYVPLEPPTQLTWLDRAGRPLETVGEPAMLFGVRLSPDGKRAATYIRDARRGARDIWIDDLERGSRSRLTADPRDALFPVWDPRGDRIVFSSARGGRLQMYLRRLQSGGEERVVVPTPFMQMARDWSPDGGRIVLEDVSPGRRPRRQLWIVVLEETPRLVPFEHGQFNKYDPRFSPDGRWMAFTSEETGRPEVFLASLDGTARRQVSSEGGSLPRWRHDGRELYYVTPDRRLVAVAIVPGPPMAVGVGQTLFSLESTAAIMSGPVFGPDYDVAGDGQRFLLNAGAESPAQRTMVVLLGWQRVLAR